MVSLRGSKYKWPRDWHAQPLLTGISWDISWGTGNSELGRVESASCRGRLWALEAAVAMGEEVQRDEGACLGPQGNKAGQALEMRGTLATTCHPPSCHRVPPEAQRGAVVCKHHTAAAAWPSEQGPRSAWLFSTCSVNTPTGGSRGSEVGRRGPKQEMMSLRGVWFEKKTHVGINESWDEMHSMGNIVNNTVTSL